MKILKLRLAVATLAVSTLGIFSFRALEGGSIKGTVTPADGAVRAWAISATDTLKASINSGSFEITAAKAGTYRVIVEASSTYKNVAKDEVVVTEGGTTDVGTIELVKKDSTASFHK